MRPDVSTYYKIGSEELGVEAEIALENGRPIVHRLMVLFRDVVDVTHALSEVEIQKIEDLAVDVYLRDREERRSGMDDVFDLIRKAGA